jgi:hypothetical protein
MYSWSCGIVQQGIATDLGPALLLLLPLSSNLE